MVVKIYGSPQWVKNETNKLLRISDWNMATAFETVNVYKVEIDITQSGTYANGKTYKVLEWIPRAFVTPLYYAYTIDGTLLQRISFVNTSLLLGPGSNLPTRYTYNIIYAYTSDISSDRLYISTENFESNYGTQLYIWSGTTLSSGLYFLLITYDVDQDIDILSGTIRFKFVGYLFTSRDVTDINVTEYTTPTPVDVGGRLVGVASLPWQTAQTVSRLPGRQNR